MKKKLKILKPAPQVRIKRFVIEIETGIPVPPAIRGPEKVKGEWPLAQMAVGESFFVPWECRTNKQMQRLAIYGKAAMKAQGLKMNFAVRFFRHLKGTRVFRTA